MDPTAFASFGSLIARAPAAGRRGVQRAAIKHRRGRVFVAPFEVPQQAAQIVIPGFEDPGPKPALGLLINNVNQGFGDFRY